MPIGDDVVDLSAPGAPGKSRDRRFVERVFDVTERAAIARARDPDLALWRLWAAKEAAFKAAAKLAPGLLFRHRLFAVEEGEGDLGWALACGLRMRVFWRRRGDCVHALAATRDCWGRAARLEAAVEELGWAEPDAQSEGARLLARALLARLGRSGLEIARPESGGGLGPPELRASGARLAGWDLSLSHDGKFVSAAVCRPSESPHEWGAAPS